MTSILAIGSGAESIGEMLLGFGVVALIVLILNNTVGRNKTKPKS